MPVIERVRVKERFRKNQGHGRIDKALSIPMIALRYLDEHLMIRRMPNVLLTNELLDWEVPT